MSPINKPKVAVIVPNWNGKEHLKKCLDSLVAQSQQASVFVIDNGSSDGSEKIAKNYPGIQLIQLDENKGFAGGVNIGIKRALDEGYKYIALFNNDAEAEKDWLKHLVACADKYPKAGIVAPKFMRSDKVHIDSTGDFYSIWGLPLPRGRNEKDSGQYDKAEEVFGGTGGASLYRAKMLEQIGLFDEDFFAYFEDVDISFRAQLAGWKVRYQPAAIAYHKIGGTSSKLGNFALYHSAKNLLLLYAKNMPRKLYLKYLPLFCLAFSALFVRSTLRGHLWTFLKGSLAAFGQHFRTVKKRRAIQQSLAVSVEYIDGILYHERPPRPPRLENS